MTDALSKFRGPYRIGKGFTHCVFGGDGKPVCQCLSFEAADHFANRLNEADAMEKALRDALSGYEYVRTYHGEIYGLGIDRVIADSRAALPESKP